ncbi:MAG: hypothetical protein MMC33_004540 [Icmadophila ericetorum]|nr:hypothetical protein [Icmadophila ericetorum]
MNFATELEKRQSFTEQLYQSPYNVRLYLQRADCHEALGFPDLAAGDAYKALLLLDEAGDESGEYHDQSYHTLETEIHEEVHTNGITAKSCVSSNRQPIENLIQEYTTTTYRSLTRNLERCGCLKSAFDFCSRGLVLDPDDTTLQSQRTAILQRNRRTQLRRTSAWDESTFDPKNDLPDEITVRRELYPWNDHEPNRFSSASLSFLNHEMGKVAPQCSVLAVTLPLLTEEGSTITEPSARQLGIFAREDIAPGSVVLHESSLLTANNRLHDPLCDACSSNLPSISTPEYLYACSECDDTVFCSAQCLEAAMSSYHPSICGKDLDFIGRETGLKDTVNALYLLLLSRTMALAETQGAHPLELKETKYIWGDFIHPDSAYVYSSSASAFITARHLPFSFTYNILSPLHVLEKMDIDIFAELERYDIWIFNTLYAKFRGTASARVSPRDGRPEVCAVHPMWCLANHSCAPNVRWEWGGDIKFVARDAENSVRWGPSKDDKGGEKWQGGIRKGEEVLNHYCDVELDLTARREWAMGPLGGVCMCDRCKWEHKGVKHNRGLTLQDC